MKKIISVALLLCMLASLCVSFASCNQVSENDVEKKPAEIISDAVSNTFSDFFEEDLGIADVFEKAKDKSSVNIYFESEDLLGGDLTRIGATVYSDVRNNSYVLSANAKYKDEVLSASAYANKNGFTVAGESLFGNGNAYTLNFDSFITDFKGSELANVIDIDPEDVDAVVKLAETLKEDLSASAKKNEKKYKDMVDNICALLEQTSTTEETTNLDGNEIKCIVATYTINNDTLKAALSHALEVVYGDLKSAEEVLGESVDDIFAEMGEDVDINIKAKLYIDRKTSKVAKITLDGKVVTISTDYFTDEKTRTEVNVNAALSISDSKIVLEASGSSDPKEVYKINVTLAKEVNGKDVTYALSADAGMGSTMKNVLNASVAFKADGALNIKADVLVDEERFTVEAAGTFKTTSNTASFEFTSLKFGDTTVTFKLGIEVSAKVDMPKVPSNAKDVLDLTEDDWEKVFEDIENSPIGKIFSDM